MKKALWWLVILVVSAVVLSLASLYGLIQSRYAPQIVSTAVNQLTAYTITTSQVHYTPPLQLTLANVELSEGDHNLQIPKLTLWLSQMPWQQGKLSFDSILVEGATLDLEQLGNPLFKSIKLHQLALQYVDISAPKWSARGVNVQIEQPHWINDTQSVPFADIQLSADQFYMQGEALNNLLVDMRYQAQQSTLFGASFNWRGGEFSGQAEQYTKGWSLVNVTIDKLMLPSSTSLEKLLTTLGNLSLPIHHINSLDILNSSFSYHQWRFENLNASLENISPTQALWQQSSGYASFDADSISNKRFVLLSTRAKLGLAQRTLSIDEFDADFKQGRVQLQGAVSEHNIALQQLKIGGVKWLEETQPLLADIRAFMMPINSLTIDELDIANSQMIQVESAPFWQVSGLGIEGRELRLIEQGRLGLWQGDLMISVSAANIDRLITTQAKMNASANQGKLVIQRAFIPLEQGYIEANGQVDRTTPSAPWQLTLHADGLPLKHYFSQQALPFELSGLAELDAQLSGLSGDYSMLAHSFSGRMSASLRQAEIIANSADGEQQFQQGFDIDNIQLNADRGRITITGDNNQTQLAGQVDLTKPQYASLLIQSQQRCLEFWSDILSKTNVINATCGDTNKAVPQNAD
ncbi:AsmA family protein [Vibrio salilacus]|uniref:AsmA family protein n=1 Tax=Vibrio salilacus TaxID=1323749 RepID=UPI000C2A91BC|nr:AsmA family protein [Vibrio salilacus]